MNMIIPEQRNNNNYENCWKREIINGIEYFNKYFYNKNFERIDNDNNEKELLLFEIETLIQ